MRFVIGYASLLSEVSIRRLFPNVGQIIPVKIPQHARCFNSFGTLSLSAGLAERSSEKLAHAAAIMRPGAVLFALAFELDDADFRTYRKHEFRYDLQTVEVLPLSAESAFDAIICYENTDHNIDVGLVDAESLLGLYKHYDTTSFWHGQYLPATIYLEHCLASARNIGPEFFDNMLDSSFLYDRTTSIRHYLQNSDVDIEDYKRRVKLSEVF